MTRPERAIVPVTQQFSFCHWMRSPISVLSAKIPLGRSTLGSGTPSRTTGPFQIHGAESDSSRGPPSPPARRRKNPRRQARQASNSPVPVQGTTGGEKGGGRRGGGERAA